jgi:Zn-dependent peptidase ImmA (M78 family)
MDAGHTLSAVDVLNNRMPPEIERRAKSFAGEFLLPSRVAADKWNAEGRPVDVSPLGLFVTQLAAAYGVPKAVAAWKLEHGAHWYQVDLRWQLDQIAKYR